jgi:hypothetical protein
MGISLTDFYPYGSGQRDTYLAKNDDGSSPPIKKNITTKNEQVYNPFFVIALSIFSFCFIFIVLNEEDMTRAID